MRNFLIFLVIAGLAYVFVVQKRNETSSADSSAVVTQAAATKATPEPLTPAPRGQASKYNYMKRALDRTRDVMDQEYTRTHDGQNP